MRLRIATVLARHGRERYPDALAKLDDFYDRQLPDAVRTTVVVDNLLPRSELHVLGRDALLIGGDNAYWEFSAWDRGLAQLDRMRQSVDLVHLVTSAFDTLYTDFIWRFDEALLRAAASATAAVGHIDYYDEPVEIFGQESQHWIRSSFFFLTPAAVHALRSMVSFEQTDLLFSDDPTRPFCEKAPISTRFQQYILSWLTSEGTGQGVTWHSHFELNSETLRYFQQKATTIVNENMLSLRLRMLGYPVVDASWLASQLTAAGETQIQWEQPWRDQVTNRP